MSPAELWEKARQEQLKQDWPWLGRYAGANAALRASGQAVDVVFMGDSITESWPDFDPGLFGPTKICRGISGQTSHQMLLRFMADVVSLQPKSVHLMGGTNDIGGLTGEISADQVADNLEAMALLAQAHDIAVLIASVPPATRLPRRPEIEPASQFRAINARMQEFAITRSLVWIDYWSVLASADGGIEPPFSEDGLHPNRQGYAAMAAILEPALSALGFGKSQP